MFYSFKASDLVKALGTGRDVFVVTYTNDETMIWTASVQERSYLSVRNLETVKLLGDRDEVWITAYDAVRLNLMSREEAYGLPWEA